MRSTTTTTGPLATKVCAGHVACQTVHVRPQNTNACSVKGRHILCYHNSEVLLVRRLSSWNYHLMSRTRGRTFQIWNSQSRNNCITVMICIYIMDGSDLLGHSEFGQDCGSAQPTPQTKSCIYTTTVPPRCATTRKVYRAYTRYETCRYGFLLIPSRAI